LPAKPRADRSLPTGTVTFLFTDIEGSTRLWETQHAAMQPALAHQRRDHLRRHRGQRWLSGSVLLPANERPHYARRVAAARAAFEDNTHFDGAWQKGRAVTLEQAVALALDEQVERT